MNTIVMNQILFNGVDIFSLSSNGIRDLYTILFATSMSQQMTVNEAFNAVIAKLTRMINEGKEEEFQKLGIQIGSTSQETKWNRFSTSTYRNIATTLCRQGSFLPSPVCYPYITPTAYYAPKLLLPTYSNQMVLLPTSAYVSYPYAVCQSLGCRPALPALSTPTITFTECNDRDSSSSSDNSQDVFCFSCPDMDVHFVFEEAIEDNEVDNSFSSDKQYSFSTSSYHCLFDHSTMNSVERVANLYHQIQLQEKQLEKAIDGNGDELEVGMQRRCKVQISSLHDTICTAQKDMEDAINDCIDFYEIELPEMKKYQDGLRSLRLSTRRSWNEFKQKQNQKRLRSERQELLGKISAPSKPKDAKQASSEITSSLLRTMRLLGQNEEKLANSGSVIDQDNSSIHKTNSVLEEYSSTMNQSTKVIQQMKNRDKLETNFLYFSITFLVCVVVFIVCQRSFGLVSLPYRILVKG